MTRISRQSLVELELLAAEFAEEMSRTASKFSEETKHCQNILDIADRIHSLKAQDLACVGRFYAKVKTLIGDNFEAGYLAGSMAARAEMMRQSAQLQKEVAN